jgi:hypothetical protein
VEYTYFMFVGDQRMEDLKQQEKQLEMEFRSFDYILTCLTSEDGQFDRVKVPLCCVVELKGFKFFCKAAQIPSKIK